MKIYKVLLIAIACLFSTFALAIPTVAQVETTISKGDYPAAKKLLEEVLAKQPDSLVANKYMMEIIKIEYAKTQVPSVEYKLYENRITAINDSIAKEKKRISDIAKEKREAERQAEVKKVFRVFGLIIILTIPLVLIYFGIREIIDRRKRQKQAAEETKRVEEWKADTRAALIDLNQFITTKQSEYIDWDILWPKLKYLQQDTVMYLQDLKNNDFNGDDINRHFENVEQYFSEEGLV